MSYIDAPYVCYVRRNLAHEALFWQIEHAEQVSFGGRDTIMSTLNGLSNPGKNMRSWSSDAAAFCFSIAPERRHSTLANPAV